jgi:hypothetical protein
VNQNLPCLACIRTWLAGHTLNWGRRAYALARLRASLFGRKLNYGQQKTPQQKLRGFCVLFVILVWWAIARLACEVEPTEVADPGVCEVECVHQNSVHVLDQNLVQAAHQNLGNAAIRTFASARSEPRARESPGPRSELRPRPGHASDRDANRRAFARRPRSRLRVE